MMWRDSITGVVVARHDEIRSARPDKTLPANLSNEVIMEEGFEEVTLTSPYFDPLTQAVFEIPPAFIDNRWQQQWGIRNLTQEEQDLYISSGKANSWMQIKSERDRRSSEGVKVYVNAEIGDKWFHSDSESRIKQLGLMIISLLGQPMPADLKWKTMDGTFVPMTSSLATSLFMNSVLADQTIFAKAEEHRILMEGSADPSTYDYLVGWPLTYGE